MKHHYGPRLRALHWCTQQQVSEALGQMELTCAQGHIMGFLAHREEPPCSKDIEESFQLSHPTVSGLLRRMEKKGFIELRPDETDRRCKRIHISAKGRECHSRIEKAILETEQQIVRDFTPEEQSLFSEFLNRALANLGGVPCPPPAMKEEL
ncbi:MAG: MarR family transcriptional regulator [Oscillospiraceae bacterium]|nr:MarR family transcriptional regulator [Oscillospiraceae bacterium]